MKIIICKRDNIIHKIEVIGHADNNILCAGFSSLFQFIFYSLEDVKLIANKYKAVQHERLSNEYELVDQDEYVDVQVLSNFKDDEFTKATLSNFVEYCMLLKKQYNLEVIINK
jgi:uncharacterized protein YsxB (DUF464 family)